MKYIMFRIEGAVPREVPVIFPDLLVHAEVAQALGRVAELRGAKVVSAGSIPSACIEPIADGESTTLNVKSRPQDGQIISMNDYFHGIL